MLKYVRLEELKELDTFEKSKSSGLMYVRGRRRVGKSWLLTTWSEKKKSRLYFSGKKDLSTKSSMTDFAQFWVTYSQSHYLLEIKPSLLSWDKIFSDIIQYLRREKKKVVFIFDEIQWLAKENSGFIGSLKNNWVIFQKENLASFIICGSSNKFFSQQVGGEEKILRGLSTRSALWVLPLTYGELKKGFLKTWKPQEIALLYMFFGGIPYYLHQINPQRGFIHAVDEALFSSSSVFLDEVNEVLSLDFNKAGVEKVKKILSQFKIQTTSQAQIRKKLKLSSSTASEIFEKLLEYNLISQVSESKAGVEIKYSINDFYLGMYFTILQNYSPLIKKSKSTHSVFSISQILNKNGYYIENFSGLAFEKFVKYHLENEKNINLQLFKKLNIKNFNFTVSSYVSVSTQVDLVIHHHSDRLVRIIECKWGEENMSEIDDLINKDYPLKNIESRLNIIIRPVKPSAQYFKKCKLHNVSVITLDDFSS